MLHPRQDKVKEFKAFYRLIFDNPANREEYNRQFEEGIYPFIYRSYIYDLIAKKAGYSYHGMKKIIEGERICSPKGIKKLKKAYPEEGKVLCG